MDMNDKGKGTIIAVSVFLIITHLNLFGWHYRHVTGLLKFMMTSVLALSTNNDMFFFPGVAS